jgi:RNase P subunit RPR2
MLTIDDMMCCCFPVCFLVFAWFISYLSYLSNESKWTAWQSLAASNDLDFIPGSLFGETRIVGNYRCHRLRLETLQKGQGNSRAYTRIVLFVKHSPNGHYPTNGYFSLKHKDGLDKQAEDLLKRLTLTGSGFRRGKVKTEQNGRTIYYEQSGFEDDVKYLQFVFDLLDELADVYPKLAALGGEIVPALYEIASDNNHNLQKVASQLLHEIGRETTIRLGHQAQHLFCPRCLVCCNPYKLHLHWWKSITYYGCRVCGQSRDLLEGWVVAVLDSQMTAKLHRQDGIMRVNWLTRRSLFDFDEVEIKQASDEDVERFAVQVGNDTDPMRQPYYKEMRCLISPGCELSQNTRRILQRMFGQVEVGETARL